MLDCVVASELDSGAELGPYPVEFTPDARSRLGELLDDAVKSGGLPLKEEDDVLYFTPAEQPELDGLAHPAIVASWSRGLAPRLPRR